MHKYEEVGPEKAIELLAKGKSVYIVIEARAGGFLAEAEEKDPCPKYNWARETDEQDEEEEPAAVPVKDVPKSPAGFAYLKTTAEAPEKKPEKKHRSAFELEDPEEEEEKPEADLQPKKPGPRKNSVDTGKICALYKAGWKAKDIAWEVKCANETVRRVLIQEGLWNPRPQGTE